jgi:YegS/Rv2252/BmrU family lipid kinase
MVVNPAAGGGRCARAWPALARRLHDAGVSFAVVFTARPGDGTRLARAAVLEGATTVVAVGGDGTANEVVNGFLEDDVPLNPVARVGLLAAGTGNDLARNFGLGGEAALAALGPHGGTQAVDVVRVRFTTPEGCPGQRYALQHAAMGLVGEASGIEFGPRAKRLFRGLVYAGAGTIAILRHRARRVAYGHDDSAEVCGRLLSLVVANAARFGGGMLIAPEAKVDDGALDVIVLREVDRASLCLWLLPSIYRGRHLGHRAVGYRRAARVRVGCDEEFVLAIDGEVAGRAPAEFEVVSGAVPLAMAPDRLPQGKR